MALLGLTSVRRFLCQFIRFLRLSVVELRVTDRQTAMDGRSLCTVQGRFYLQQFGVASGVATSVIGGGQDSG